MALLRHGQRAGALATGRDVVDHDVDVMVGVESEMAWLMLRWTINMKLRHLGADDPPVFFQNRGKYQRAQICQMLHIFCLLYVCCPCQSIGISRKMYKEKCFVC